MTSWQERTELLLGDEAVRQLQKSHVLVAGLGGVGGYVADILVRSGVGKLTIADGDTVSLSNINRQILALRSTVGLPKVEVARNRLLDINPNLQLETIGELLHGQLLKEIASQPYSVIVDAIDTLTPKAMLIKTAFEHQTPLVVSLGCGARVDPTMVRVDDLWETRGCPLGSALRKRLRKLKVNGNCPAVYSPELPNENAFQIVESERFKKSTTGVIAYMPAIFGTFAAATAIRLILNPSAKS